MFRALRALLQDGQNPCHVAGQESGRIEPESRKDDALVDSVRGKGQQFVSSFAQDEPVALSPFRVSWIELQDIAVLKGDQNLRA